MNESSWTLVAELPLSQNIEPLLKRLEQLGVAHNVVTDNARQSLWVENPEHIPLVDELLQQLSKPRRPSDPWFDEAPRKARTSLKSSGSIKALFREFPVTMYSILLSAIGALLVYVDLGMGLDYSLIGALTFQPLIAPYSPLQSFLDGQFWRPISPIFLHFGFTHLAFNGMCLWLFGARIERLLGAGRLVVLMLITALISNVAQYLWLGPHIFGGMSGVAFGLAGFVWVRHQFRPDPLTELPAVLVFMMLLSLFLGISGALDSLVGGKVANAAHLGGLLSGAILGWFSAQAADARR
ncbi:rhomboid family intramembrane serine protease [Porticoccaceae bacterium LTM1]|nr:rhomboid family intramembrane serine protease [Porticoccaceae bacterium LTM1]